VDEAAEGDNVTNENADGTDNASEAENND